MSARFLNRCRGGNTADAIGWLKLGPMDAGGTGRDTALQSASGSYEHIRFTQVQGPREEVKPLLLPVSLSV